MLALIFSGGIFAMTVLSFSHGAYGNKSDAWGAHVP